jgi:hypothetical protein
MFNPNNYTMKRTNSWVSDKTKTSNSPKLSFSSGGATTLDMELFFDTYEEGTDVRLHTEPLWLFMRIDEDNKPSGSTKGQPPTVVFAWGLIWFFEAVITSLTEKFTLFLPSGIPVRSTVTVTFKQLKDPLEFAFTNPTSGGGEPQRIHVVQAGERLDWIAYREYGDSTMWRIIAQENGLIRPRSLRPGQKLIIPAL